MKSQVRKVLFGLALTAFVVGAGMVFAQPTEAARYRISVGSWHAPSVHYDRVYHPTQVHWTPNSGWHTHGHYDVVPHYTPGHVHYYNNGNVRFGHNHHGLHGH
jgi:hypothetical protein